MNTAKQKESLVKYWKSENTVKDEKVIDAFMKVPRENFVLPENLHEAYGDYPLDIGFNVTISQPTTVVIMLESLDVKKGNKILEIGTGSGYTASLLSVLAGNKGKIYSTEIVKELADFAKRNLKKLKIRNVKVFHHDGSKGLERYMPYDRIILHAAAEDIPEEIIKQLKNNGIFIGPIGNQCNQNLIKITKKKNKVIKENLGDFIFVPLQRK